MSSNYPPGVTGNEYAIAGPDREWEDQRACENEDCPVFAETQEVVMQSYDYQQWWTCERCGMQHDEEMAEADDYEPERDRYGDD